MAPTTTAAENAENEQAETVTLTKADLAALREEIRQDVAGQFDRFKLDFLNSACLPS